LCHRPGAWKLSCRPGPRPPLARQPDERDLIRACRPDSSQCCPPGRRACHPRPAKERRRPSPAWHTLLRPRSPSGLTPTLMSTSPTRPINSAAVWTPSRFQPLPLATRTCWPGREGLARSTSGAWTGPRRSLDSSRFVRFNLRGAAAVNMLLHRSGGHRGVNNDPDICLITRERRGPDPRSTPHHHAK
jgi:hypothetical protein